ncbi:MAG: ATP-binding protein [Defluviitaleaceae bacterium]|nr:ATP-binding protein [Defluviitaleaceae bacterium]
MKNVSIIKQHGKMIAILAFCLSIPFIAIWYIASDVNKNIYHEQKSNNLMSFARILDSQLAFGGYNEILANAGMENAPREEQIRTLNEALRTITDEVAHSTPGLGVGYYSYALDAILTYGPSEEHHATVGISIGEAHPGRRVMATGIAEVSMGTMVRGNIMNAMLPIVREGEIIGYIWANNLVSELEQTLSQMSSIILLLLILSYVIMLAIIVLFIRRMLLTEQKFMKALSEALEEAKTANQTKSAFLSTMSHEIRTPMNAILGITEIQLQNETLDQAVRDGLEKVYTSGDMLLNIINDILDLSKIEAGKFELVISKYETASLISDTAQLNMMRIGSKPINFELNVEEDLPVMLCGDELRIKQILNNLLSNAIKYTSTGTVKVFVSSKPMEGDDEKTMLTVSVSDTGQGMSKEQVDKLFDEYSRFNLEANRSTEGTGLGMSITRNLIHMMDGDITIESEPGKGSIFTVLLPQTKVDDAVLGREMVEALHNFRSSSRAQMKRTQIIRDPMPYGRVLIVDDVGTNIYVARGLLTPYGLSIDSVDSGISAIEKIKQGNVYDIVFMDHMMPNMDGVEATKIIRDMNYSQPIIALTANAVVGQADIFLKNGFDDFISKPIDVRQLNLVLNKFIRDKQPPEVIEAAKQLNGLNKKAQDNANPSQTDIDPQLIELFMQDANKAIDVLDSIIKKGSPYSAEDIRIYIIHTHGVKNALANINKNELSATAYKLEQLGRDNNTESITAETPGFLDALRELVNTLAPPEEETTEEPASENEPLLREKLLEIKAACEDWDKGKARETLAVLRKNIWPKQTKDLLEKINEQLLHSDFDEIEDEIDKFTNKKPTLL